MEAAHTHAHSMDNREKWLLMNTASIEYCQTIQLTNGNAINHLVISFLFTDDKKVNKHT